MKNETAGGSGRTDRERKSEGRKRAIKREVRVLKLSLSLMTVQHHRDLPDITEALTST